MAMDRTPAIDRLITVVQTVAARLGQRLGRKEMSEEDMAPITQLVASLTPEALGISANAHAYITPSPTLPTDIRYLHIAQEDNVYSIGVFILPPGACIPLHDHPNMCVVSHALYGAVKITQYDRVQEGHAESSELSVSIGASSPGLAAQVAGGRGRIRGGGGWGKQETDLAVLSGCAWHQAPHTSCLTPLKANVHQLEAGHQGVGILDVLIPPYNEACDRDCTYFEVHEAQDAPAAAGTGAAPGGYRQPGGRRVRLVPNYPNDKCAVTQGRFVSPLSAASFAQGTS